MWRGSLAPVWEQAENKCYLRMLNAPKGATHLLTPWCSPLGGTITGQLSPIRKIISVNCFLDTLPLRLPAYNWNLQWHLVRGSFMLVYGEHVWMLEQLSGVCISVTQWLLCHYPVSFDWGLLSEWHAWQTWRQRLFNMCDHRSNCCRNVRVAYV